MNAHQDPWPYEWPCVDHGWTRSVCQSDCVLWDGVHTFPISEERSVNGQD